jgi:hypothetical protein
VFAAEFVSLADLLRAPRADAASAAPAAVCAPPADDRDAPASREIVDAVREAKRFRARLADAFDAAAARLLRDLAGDVLARELRLAPCDLSALVARVHARAPVVRVRVAPEDGPRVRDVPVVVDETLRAGDAIVEVTGGGIDARLGVRLGIVLEAVA